MHLRRFFDLLSDLLSHQKFHALRERRPLAGRENPPQERFRIADGDDLNLPIDLPPVFLRDEGEGRARLLCGFELILHPAHGQNLPMQTDLAGQRQRIWHGRFRISRIEREEHRRPRRRSIDRDAAGEIDMRMIVLLGKAELLQERQRIFRRRARISLAPCASLPAFDLLLLQNALRGLIS